MPLVKYNLLLLHFSFIYILWFDALCCNTKPKKLPMRLNVLKKKKLRSSESYHVTFESQLF